MTPSRSTSAPRGAHPEPVKEFFSIGEVCDLTGQAARPSLLGEPVPLFNPAKNRSGNRVYQRRKSSW